MWEVGTEMYMPFVAEAMCRNRSELIKCYLHRADNSCNSENDKFAKMRSVTCILNEHYARILSLKKNLCIHESITPHTLLSWREAIS